MLMPFPLSDSYPHSSEHKLELAKDFSVVWASVLVLVMAKPRSLLNCTGHAWHKTYLWLTWLTSKPLWLLARVLCFLFYLSKLKLLICKYLKLKRFSLETELVDRQNLVLPITTHFTQSMSQLVLKMVKFSWWPISGCGVGHCRLLSALACWTEQGVLLSQDWAKETPPGASVCSSPPNTHSLLYFSFLPFLAGLKSGEDIRFAFPQRKNL